MARKLPVLEANLSPLATQASELGSLIRNARAQAGLRIDDAAALCGVSSDFLSRLENGKPVTTERLFKLLDGLGLQLVVLPKAVAKRLSESGEAL